jgi:tRNA G18 (ribose-2'-O)-methylase SpoU
MKQLILENLRSAHNVGSIFRTADAAGVHRIHLVGHTPAPLDRFGRVQPEIEKTSLGASTVIPWCIHADIHSAVADVRAPETSVVAVEQTAAAISLADYSTPASVVYIFGNEVSGVSEAALAAADTIVEIPMRGSKESLNVSVAAGIVLYHGLV